MNILILGGNRYFGKEVVRQLSKFKKNKIYVLNRNRKKNLFKNIKFLKCDRKNFSQLKKKIGKLKFDIIWDNIAYDLKDVKNLLKIQNNIKLYIFSSTIIVSKIIKKNNKLLSRNYHSSELIYAENKYKIEKYLQQNYKKFLILRIHSVIGKNDFSEKTKDFLKTNENNLEKFNIKLSDKIQFIYKEDLVRIIKYLILKYNLINQNLINLSNDPIEIKDVIKIINNNKKNSKINRKKYPIPINLIENNKRLSSIIPFKLTNTKEILKKLI